MQCNSKRRQSDAYVNRQTIKNQHRWTTNPEHSTKSRHWPSPTILVHKRTCNNPTFLNEAKHLLIKIALFFKSIVLMKQHIVARSKVFWINRPNQIGKVEAYRLRTRRVWNIHAFACVCASGHVVEARVWSLHEGAGAEVMENCMCGCYWQRGDGLDGQLRGKLRSRPRLMKAESGLKERNASEFGMGRERQRAKKRNETNCSI